MHSEDNSRIRPVGASHEQEVGKPPLDRNDERREDWDASANLADLRALIERGRRLTARSRDLMLRLASLFRDQQER